VSNNRNYEVQMDWPSVTPVGDSLAVKTGDGFDARWVRAFDVVLEEQQRRAPNPKWGGIDFHFDENESRFAVYVRKIDSGAKAADVRRILDDLVDTANQVARVGPHVYELARELREPISTVPGGSAPPPPGEQAGN
jgi:hypothetical protein